MENINLSANYDICIVGSGPAGISIAKHLSKKKIRIAILEKGPFEFDSPMFDYQIKTSNLPIRKNSRNIGLGGTSNSWASLSGIFEPDEVTNDNSYLWGIEYKEFIKNYEEASNNFGFPSFESFNECNHNKLKKYNIRAKKFVGLANRLKFRDHYEDLLGKENITFFFNSEVIKFCFDESGEVVKSCTYVDEENNNRQIFSKIFVCASGGIENASILQRSIKNSKMPIGRFFMDHYKFRSGVFEIYDHLKFNDFFGGLYKGMPTYLGITNHDKNSDLNPYLRIEPIYPWSKGTATNSFISLIKPFKEAFTKISYRFKFNASVMSSSEYAEDRDLDNGMGFFKKVLDVVTNANVIFLYVLKRIFPSIPIYPKRGIIFNHIDMQARYENKIIDKSYLNHSNEFIRETLANVELKKEINSIKDIHDKFSRYIKSEKLGKYTVNEECLHNDSLIKIVDASHHMGTTRIGKESNDSVVDSDLKVHGVKNLYISGTSVFRKGQNANPTYTIVALSLRLATHLNEKYFKIS